MSSSTAASDRREPSFPTARALSRSLGATSLFVRAEDGLAVYVSNAPASRNGADYAVVFFDHSDPSARSEMLRQLFVALRKADPALDCSFTLVVIGAELGQPATRVEVLLCAWELRDRLRAAVDEAIAVDSALGRLVLGQPSCSRSGYDEQAIRTFRRAGAGVLRQFFGPFRQSWRLSGFSLHEAAYLLGMTFELVFAELADLERAERVLKGWRRERGELQHALQVPWFNSIPFGETDAGRPPVLRLVMRWNTDRARAELAAVLSALCGLTPGAATPPGSARRGRTDIHAASLGLAGRAA